MRKIYIYLFSFVFMFYGLALGQSSDKNYIKTIDYTTENADSTSAIINIQYFDGLGRNEQLIQYKASTDGKSLVTKTEYDGFGRQAVDFLPVPMNSSLNFNEPSTINGESYYQNQFGENTWYSEKTFEDSPLNRVLSQAAPGDDWAKGAGHEIEFQYETNKNNEVRIYKYDENNQIQNIGFYNANTLYKTITTDENGNEIIEFKDKQGKVILKKAKYIQSISTLTGPPTLATLSADTYYIYDIYSNLVAVIPPLAAQNVNITTEIQNNLCYLYRYDDKNRLIEKKLPGKGWEYMLYDKQDRLVATQDANLEAENKWLFTKYDKFGRIVYTGIFNTPTPMSRDSVQLQLDGFGSNNEERKSNVQFTQNGLQVYYTKNAFPTNFNEILSVNYYDTYDGLKPDLDSAFEQNFISDQNGQLKGMPLSSHIRILNSNSWEKSYTVYDNKRRAIGTYKQNHLGGFTKTESELNFSGLPTKSTTVHKRNQNGVEVTVVEQFTYDHMLRLTTHTHSVNGGIPQVLAKNTYDELGQLKNKKVGGDNNMLARWQSVDYKYNIRGWLTDINNVNLGMLGEYQFPMSAYDDLFSFKIMYNEIFEDTGNGAQPLFNGNIAQTFWKTGSNNKLRGYDYSYDSLNRLLRAEFYNSEVQPYTGAYNEIINYDLNGNITSLNRTTGDNSGAAVAMDELTYTYKDGNGNSNVLLNVSDAVSPQSTDGFIDGNTDPMLNDYEYDQNGNMILDRNKGITEIKYNHLNLPTRITWANNKYISYQYNALGQKVGKSVNHSDTIKTVNYLDGFQYAGNQLQFFPTAEGYVKATPTDRTKTNYHFNYIYNYTDHLGNVRLSYTKDPQAGTLKIVDENHYYPFGLRHEIHYPSSRSRDFRAAEGLGGGQVGDPVTLVNVTKTEYMYKYNGFEYQDELGLGWYDYMARNYDPAIGRWMNIDPLAEMSRKTSPYVYALNNPVYFIDPDGMMAEASSDKSGSDGANSDNYSGMTTGVKLAFGVSLDSVINSGAAVSFYGNLQSTGRKEAEAERFASNIDTGDPKSGGNGNNTSESKNHGATIATSTYSALGEYGEKALESGEYTQTNGKKGNFNDRPYNRLSRNGKAHFDRAKGLSKLRLLGTVGNIYSFGDGVWKDYNSFANGEPSIENTAGASGGILGGIVVGAAAGGGASLMTCNPYVITGFTIVGGILGSFLGEEAVRELFNNSYDYNNGTPFIHKR